MDADAGVDADQEDDERAVPAAGLHHPHLRAAALAVLYQVRPWNTVKALGLIFWIEGRQGRGISP